MNAIPSFFFSGRLIGVSLGDVVGALAGAGAASVAMGAVVWVVDSRLHSHVGAPLQLTVGVVTGIATYLLALRFFSPASFREIRKLRA